MTVAHPLHALSQSAIDEQVCVIPRDLIQELEASDGAQGCLTLTREHIATLQQYCTQVSAIPSQRQPLIDWLGYSVHADVELAIIVMQQMVENMHLHAQAWHALYARCRALPGALAECARLIDRSGEQALMACEKTKALGSRRDAWQSVQFDAPIALSAGDQAIVSDLTGWLQVMRQEVGGFHAQVSGVREEVEAFRDAARFRLRPQLARKIDALRRTDNSPAMLQMRATLASLDSRIDVLGKEYQRCIVAALGNPGMASVVYRSKAEQVRQERNALQLSRTQTSAELARRGGAEGRLETLAGSLGQLITRLEEVTTSSSYLQTAWQLIDTYIQASIAKIGTLQDSQQLGKFIIHFKNFLAQWAFIEQRALAMAQRLQA